MTTDRGLASEVERRIREALAMSADRDPEQISVTTHGGRVTLHGTVRSWTEHQDAGRAAAETPGVASVDNELALLVKGTIGV
jgi:osmotically-inducible protein OsmY